MKLFKWLLAILLVLGAGYFVYTSSQCSLDGNTACFVEGEDRFLVEEDAHLSVQVENEALKEFLLSEWSKHHSETVLDVSVQPVLTLSELKDLPFDVMVVNQEDAAYFMNEFQDLGNNAYQLIGSRIPVNLQDAINLKGFYLAQNTVSGPLFVYNKTLMDEMDLGLFTSFEDLFAAGYRMPISFLDQESFYPYLTAGGWSLYSSHVGTKPGVDSKEFLDGLTFIADFPKKGDSALSLPWDYESAFFDRDVFVSILKDREFASQHELKNGDTYVYAPFPTYKGKRMSPLASVNGYVVKKESGFTSAASEVIRILRSPGALALNEGVSVYHSNHLEDLDLDAKTASLVEAYSYSTAIPIIALESNPNVLVRSSFREVDIMDLLAKVYDGDLLPNESQELIVERWNQWLISKEVKDVVE